MENRRFNGNRSFRPKSGQRSHSNNRSEGSGRPASRSTGRSYRSSRSSSSTGSSRPSYGSHDRSRSGNSSYNRRPNSSEASGSPSFSDSRRSSKRSYRPARQSSEGYGERRSFSGGRSFNLGNRGGFRGRGSRGGNNSRRSRIDISKLVNKAVTPAEEVAYKPTHAFADFNIDQKLKNNIAAKGYVTPTPIQDQAIPFGLEGKDIVGIANTGTGKTAAFLIPLIDKVIKNPGEKVLIIVPTRELAMQIQDEFRGFSKDTGIFSVVCIGGTSMYKQFSNLKRKYNFIIGTPGRLKDLANRRAFNLANCHNIVLDEVDRMLDMGFINDIRFLLELLPEKKQSLFFSATITREIEQLIQGFLTDPVKISLKTRETAESVDQDVVRVADHSQKIEVLHELLIKEEFVKVLIFAKTKMGVRRLSENLYARGFKVESIHGDKTQARRQKALDLFKQSRINILVATDVAARGLDIADVSHVINFDLPDTYEEYVHRIGRTGRANKKGVALSFIQ